MYIFITKLFAKSLGALFIGSSMKMIFLKPNLTRLSLEAEELFRVYIASFQARAITGQPTLR